MTELHLTEPRQEGSMPDRGTGAALLEAAKTFRSRILAERDHIEAARRIPEDLAQDLAHAGFFRIHLPEVYGGSISRQWKRWRFSRSWRGRTPRSLGACGAATLIGPPPNSRPRPREPSMPTPTS